ncbi:LuxR C-terminal-related transcriptional regulator [Streptomyces luteireticuli]|uniref:helix-turn-helix transcriptional regulator n=1 Tax=Streptomyces luteireticuli TaxID=173858 RepID=UPI003557BEA0
MTLLPSVTSSSPVHIAGLPRRTASTITDPELEEIYRQFSFLQSRLASLEAAPSAPAGTYRTYDPSCWICPLLGEIDELKKDATDLMARITKLCRDIMTLDHGCERDACPPGPCRFTSLVTQLARQAGSLASKFAQLPGAIELLHQNIHPVQRPQLASASGIELPPPILEVLSLAAAGCTNDHIARRLNRPLTTVTRQLAEARRRLNATDRAHAAALATALGLITVDLSPVPRA